MTTTRPSVPRLEARRARRVILGASLGLLALGLAIGPAQGASAVSASIANNTLTVTGSKAADVIVLRLAAGDPNTLEVDLAGDGSAEFTFDRSRFDRIVVAAGGGNDTIRIDQSGGLFTDTEITRLDGGAGSDTITGGSGPETLIGGAGDDLLDGNQGADTIVGGSGADTIVWDPGDGSDVIDGGDGTDTLAFNGANIGELMDVSANGKRVRFTRDIGAVVLDLGTLERLAVRALGGADTVTVDNLAGTDLKSVSVDLAAFGGAGDGLPDSVVVNGTAGNDTIAVNAVAGGVETSGLAATVRVTGSEPALDALTVNGLAGNDVIIVGAGVPALIQVIANP
jgi:Ca2+-binding RTX toxin-like protein